MRPALPFALVIALSLAAGCHHDDEHDEDTTSGDEAEQGSTAPLHLAGVVPGPFVTAVQGGCTSGPDACAGAVECVAAPVDCGGDSDRIRITAHWSSSDDVDLYVTDRLGDTLSFMRPTNLTGGRMILAEGRTCLPSNTLGEEAATFTGPHVTLGRYVVVLQHFGSCMSGLGQVDVDITLSAGGRYLGAYRVSIAPQDRSEVLNLDVAE